MGRATNVGFLAAGVALALGAYELADSYGARVANHAGVWLVPVPNMVHVPVQARPRHALVVVVDGLRADAARTMHSVRSLEQQGTCTATDVGLPSVSRPVYAELSTGLEQDRTGVRFNEGGGPVAAESIWEVARRAGLRVEGRSSLTWWTDIFPRGFAPFRHIPMNENSFAPSLAADLTLIHPVYVDEESHSHGALSPETHAAVARADTELGRMLTTVDFTRDLVVFTADHGHRDRGGHGGSSPEVRYVLSCFAGFGVRVPVQETPMSSRAIAPLLATWEGVPFPRHMRAVEDGLDEVLDAYVDPNVVGARYLADRHATLGRFRTANVRALTAWSGGDAQTWSAFYAMGARMELMRFSAGVTLLLVLLGLALARRPSVSQRIEGLLLVVFVPVALVLGYALVAGYPDMSSLNSRSDFEKHTAEASLLALSLASLGHWLRARSAKRLRDDAAHVVGSFIVLNAAHIVAYGWPMTAPLGGPLLYFAPYLLSGFLLSTSAWLALVSLANLLRARRKDGI